jgi:hypothetical protein
MEAAVAAAPAAVFAAGAALTLSVSSSRKRLFNKSTPRSVGAPVPFSLEVGAQELEGAEAGVAAAHEVVAGASPASLGDGDAGAGPSSSAPRASLVDEAVGNSGTSVPDASAAWAAARAELQQELEDRVGELGASFASERARWEDERARWEDERQSLRSQLLRKDAELQRLGAVEVKLSDTIASKNFVSAELERVRRLADRLEKESVNASNVAGMVDELAEVRCDLQAARHEAARERELTRRQLRDDKARYDLLVDQFHDKEEQIKRLEKENDLLAAAAESAQPRLVKQVPVSAPEQHALRAQHEQELAALQAQLDDALAEAARAAAERDLACGARDKFLSERDVLIEQAKPLEAAAAEHELGRLEATAVAGAVLALFMW